MGRFTKAYAPLALEMAVRVRCVSSAMAVTVTLGTKLPLASTTVPSMLPKVCWARAGTMQMPRTRTKDRKAVRRTLRNTTALPPKKLLIEPLGFCFLNELGHATPEPDPKRVKGS